MKIAVGLAVLVAVLLSACGVQGQQASVVVTKQDAQVSVQSTAEQMLVDVKSPTGIGAASIRLAPGARPARVTLRFHLAGLESLSFRYGQTTVAVSVSQSGQHRALETVSTGSAADARPITSSSPFWMTVTIVSKDDVYPVQDGYIDVEAPRDFLSGSETQFSFDWVDFYR